MEAAAALMAAAAAVKAMAVVIVATVRMVAAMEDRWAVAVMETPAAQAEAPGGDLSLLREHHRTGLALLQPVRRCT
jgi:hypothetical protein